MVQFGKVAVVDYGLANLRSVVNAVECFTPDVYVAEQGEDLDKADKIILPGVGHFDRGMRGLRERGHEHSLNRLVQEKGVPLLGICLGFQFLFEGSGEGSEKGLGWIGGRIELFPGDAGIKVPHIGWSEVTLPRKTRLFAEILPPVEFYFVHSYCAPDAGDAGLHASAICHHGVPFVAALEKDHIFATQFHPEKSQLAGMKLIETFLTL